MKRVTIWRRLNTSLAFLIILLLIGATIAFVVEDQRKQAFEQSNLILQEAGQIRLQMVTMSDALRGVLLDPKQDSELKRIDGMDGASNALATAITQMNDRFESDHPRLADSLKRIRDYDKKRGEQQSKLIQLQETDPAAAAVQYAKTYPALRQQLDLIMKDFDRQVQYAAKEEADKSEPASTMGLVALAGILVIVLIVGYFQSAALTKPLVELVDALEKMRHGDFATRLKFKQRDEFGMIADGLDRLADDLSVLVGQVQRSGIQVNTTATEISATAREQQSTANQIAATTSEIGATSKQISATSRELVRTMNEVNDVSEETAQLAGSGQVAIISMESTLRQLTDASGSITTRLAVLSEKTSNINSVVTTITKVADQTNLLSLNAAIEAEKAGEYGLGFAVVAMEIRRLADQTAVATYDIEKMVKEMQTAVAAGVMGMDKFSEELRRSVESIRQVSAQLAQIIHQVQALNPRFQLVNEGMRSQATGALQISETLTELSDAARQTAESLRQSNQAIEQLNEAARGLQNSVTRFKLENP